MKLENITKQEQYDLRHTQNQKGTPIRKFQNKKLNRIENVFLELKL